MTTMAVVAQPFVVEDEANIVDEVVVADVDEVADVVADEEKVVIKNQHIRKEKIIFICTDQ